MDEKLKAAVVERARQDRIAQRTKLKEKLGPEVCALIEYEDDETIVLAGVSFLVDSDSNLKLKTKCAKCGVDTTASNHFSAWSAASVVELLSAPLEHLARKSWERSGRILDVERWVKTTTHCYACRTPKWDTDDDKPFSSENIIVPALAFGAVFAVAFTVCRALIRCLVG